MLAKDMCSQNQKVGHLICLIHNNVFWIQRIVRVLRNSLFRTNDLYSKKIKRSKIFAKKELAPFFTGRPSEEGVVFRGNQSLF